MGLVLGKALILGVIGAVLGYVAGFAVSVAFHGGAFDQNQLFDRGLLMIALFLAPVEDTTWAAWPVGLYAGWLSAAACVSFGLLAAGYGWLDQRTAALIFVGLAIVIGALVQEALGRAPTYGIAVIWALVAVVVKNLPSEPILAYVAGGGAVVLLIPTLRAFRTL